MKRIALILFLLCLVLAAAFGQGYDPAYKPLRSQSLVQDKNFYLLTLMRELPALRQVIQAQPELTALTQTRNAQLIKSASECTQRIECQLASVRWEPGVVDQVARLLGDLYDSSPAVRDLVLKHMRPSGRFQFHAALADKEFLQAAWRDAAKGMNNLYDVYGLGKKPRYPRIDSVSYNVKGNYYPRVVEMIALVQAEKLASYSLFFESSLEFALELLIANERDEAARYEPLEAKENAAAYAYIRSIQWEQYPYTLTLILGYSPERADIRLNPVAKHRLQIGVRNYFAGKAPLIVVSGGHVYPDHTPYCEALEMKRYLMDELGVPERAILIDPHARHTTTNMRNTARLMYHYGIPTDKKAIVNTDKYHSAYLSNPAIFDKRNMNELGYLPYVFHDRLSIWDLEFTPVITSLHHDAMDPMDP